MLAQRLQHRLGFGEYGELVARMNERFKAHIGHFRGFRLWITGLFERVHQHAVAQHADAVLELGMAFQHLLAKAGEMLQGQFADLGGMGGQPFAHRRFGADDDGDVVPEGVVQVEGDQLDTHESPPLMRLARGWALSYTVARCWKSRWV